MHTYEKAARQTEKRRLTLFLYIYNNIYACICVNEFVYRRDRHITFVYIEKNAEVHVIIQELCVGSTFAWADI